MYKYLGLDIFGTILGTSYISKLPLRKGTNKFLEFCKEKDIKVIITSDYSLLESHIRDLELLLTNKGLKKELYQEIFKMTFIGEEKGFCFVKDKFDIYDPSDLLIIGDEYNADINGALYNNSHGILVPKYLYEKEDFSFENLIPKSPVEFNEDFLKQKSEKEKIINFYTPRYSSPYNFSLD